MSDTGIGIAPEDLQRIFRALRAGGHPLANQAGTGLGLTISRQYVQMMGSELTVESTPGQGSSFRFAMHAAGRLCALRHSRHSHGRVVGLAPADRGKRILVVDDIAEARLLLRALLEPLGFEMAEAEDGARSNNGSTRSSPN